MPSTFGNAAKKLPDTPDEPSMDEILASIRDIISQDEAGTGGEDERAQYTHPTDVSNANKALPTAAPMPAAPAVSQETRAEPRKVLPPSMPLANSSPKASAANQELSTKLKTIEERAAKIRADLGFKGGNAEESNTNLASSSAKLKLEQLAEARHAGSGQFDGPVPIPRQAEPAAEKVASAVETAPALRPAMQPHTTQSTPKAAETSAFAPAPKPEPRPEMTADTRVSTPATAELGSTFDQIAANLLEEKSEDLEAMLGDMMRPVVRKWLGENLPTLVERLVREEIEKVSKGRK